MDIAKYLQVGDENKAVHGALGNGGYLLAVMESSSKVKRVHNHLIESTLTISQCRSWQAALPAIDNDIYIATMAGQGSENCQPTIKGRGGSPSRIEATKSRLLLSSG
jgi:hypothetical protein